jgi:hypothetical protein
MTVRLSLMQLAARRSERADFLTCPRCGTRMPEVPTVAPMGTNRARRLASARNARM